MKRIFSVFMGFLLIFSLSSCAEDKENKKEADKENEIQQSEESSSGEASDRGDTPTYIQGGNSSDVLTTEMPAEVFAVLTLSSSVAEVSPGESVTVKFKVSDCLYMACLDVFLEADAGLTLADRDVYYISDFSSEFSENTSEGYSKSRISGFTMYTCDFSDVEVAEVTYKIPEDAKSGETYSIRVVPYDIQIGKDENGAELINITNNVVVNEITFTVK